MTFPLYSKSDFENIIYRDLSQPITIYHISRTVDADGHITEVAYNPVNTRGVVIYVTPQHLDWVQSGIITVGDIVIYVKNSETVAMHDRIDWDNKQWHVVNITYPMSDYNEATGQYEFAYIQLHCKRFG